MCFKRSIEHSDFCMQSDSIDLRIHLKICASWWSDGVLGMALDGNWVFPLFFRGASAARRAGMHSVSFAFSAFQSKP